tara:strand:+ start:4067 stop:5173 length:1107 start_codon:yes stop_codon:yes gene_type:complete
MIIKKYFQNLFKITFQNFFKIFYGNVFYSNSKKNISIHEIENEKIISYFKKKYKVYQILFGRIYNDNVQNVAILDKNQIVDGPSYQQINGELKSAQFNICIKIGTPKIKKKFKGRVLNLAQGASGHNNYSHWLLDILPKLKLYNEIFNYENLNYIYLNKLNSFQRSSLDLLGLEKVKILDSNKFRHIQCDELIATDHPSYFKGYILDQAQYVPNWIVTWLRDSFLNKSKNTDYKEKVFIDRSMSKFKHSQIINYSETINFLKEKNFEIIKLENLSFVKQISLFKNAKIVVGAHGAGLTNICFSQSGSKIIEIRSSKPGYGYQNKVYERISQINRLNYKLYSTPFIAEKNIDGDLNIDINKLNDFLKDV